MLYDDEVVRECIVSHIIGHRLYDSTGRGIGKVKAPAHIIITGVRPVGNWISSFVCLSRPLRLYEECKQRPDARTETKNEQLTHL